MKNAKQGRKDENMEGTPYSLDGKNGSAVSGTRLDAAGDVGEVEPNFDAAEVAAC